MLSPQDSVLKAGRHLASTSLREKTRTTLDFFLRAKSENRISLATLNMR